MNPTPPAPPPADADLNRLCAEEMGISQRWECVNPECIEYGVVSESRVIHTKRSAYCPGVNCGNDLKRTKLPAFATDPSAALLLVDALRKEGWWINMVSAELEDDRPGWEVDIGHKTKSIPNVSDCADTLPRAIALAFLKTKGRIQ